MPISFSVQGSSDLLRVQKGENISLNCSMRNRYEVAWYHLRSGELELLISAKKDESGRKLLTNYNPNSPRLKMTADAWVTRATLVISGVTESDSGLYFCGTKSDAPEMFFDKPFRLEIEGLSVTEEPKVDITVVAGGIIHYHGWQKGWAAAKKRSSLIHHK
ncbi:hypothetical protein G5714_019100 [Onychostoma macrolepis]|uniref:Ig-like domain-containing protein n=1 Tax=Onychostoma macrolepis TaxID=369639 RepID=A0A7J6C1P8_9TELE|nr:hypothetical protein G5714_019100 [Onychostoma macrolepis]